MCTPEEGCLHICVIRGDEMALVDMDYDPATGDSTYHGQPFSEAFPVTASFARNAEWHVNNEPITYRGRRYVKYGLPRVLAPGDVVRDGDVRGVPAFVEPPAPRIGVTDVIYLPVKPTCEFQPYEILGIK